MRRGNDLAVRIESNGAYWKAKWATGSRSLGPKSDRELQTGKPSRATIQRARAIELDMRSGVASATACPRLSAFVERYFAHRHGRLSAGTVREYRRVANLLTDWFDDDPPIDRIARIDAEDWRAAMVAGDIDGRSKSEQTACKIVRSAAAIIGHAVKLGIIDHNPFGRLERTPAPIEKDWQRVTLDDARAIMDAAQTREIALLVALTRFAGMRLNEARAVRWRDIDINTNRIRVPVTKTRRKSGVRVCPVEANKYPTGLATILADAMGEPDSLIAPPDRTGKTHPQSRLATAIAAAGLPEISAPFQTFRKECESDLRAVYMPWIVGEWLGHSEQVGADYYGRVPDDLYAPPSPNLGRTSPQTAGGQQAGSSRAVGRHNQNTP